MLLYCFLSQTLTPGLVPFGGLPLIAYILDFVGLRSWFYYKYFLWVLVLLSSCTVPFYVRDIFIYLFVFCERHFKNAVIAFIFLKNSLINIL